MTAKQTKKSTSEKKASVSAESLKPESAPINDQQDTIDALTQQIADLKTLVNDLKDQNTRLVAEQHNLGNRLRREFDTKKEYAISGFAKEILDVGDILTAGLENCSDKESEHYRGMDMTLDKFYHILEQHGISKIASHHEPFNHDVHEALTSQETDELEPGHVMQVIQEGYKFKERVLRPAKVIVSKKVSDDS